MLVHCVVLWDSLQLFGMFRGHFVAIWSTFPHFGIFTRKNLATLPQDRSLLWEIMIETVSLENCTLAINSQSLLGDSFYEWKR
jgi:hypothetical protein